jgi:Xaa-Pro aminopeptidase
MYPHQIERLTAALDAAGGEALVACSPANVAYVTGYHSLTRALRHAPQFGVFTRQGAALVVPAGEVAAAVEGDVDVEHLVCYGEPSALSDEAPGPLARRVHAIVARRTARATDALAAALGALGVRGGVVALDDARLPGDIRQDIARALGDTPLAPGSAHLAEARRAKAPFEIECLVAALGIAEEALNEVVQMLKRGVTEREATGLYFTEIVKRGAEPRPSSIAMGERTALGAVWPSERALRPRELVRLDVVCVYRGYTARVGRTAVLGDPSPEQDAVHGALQAALEAAVDAAGPGRTSGAVYEAARGAMREHGLADVRWTSIGHGIGLELDELPRLVPEDPTVLEPGEVLSIEVAHDVIGRGGLLARDTVLVTAAGARVLNRSARGLVSLD